MINRSTAESNSWSRALSERYSCALSGDLVDWFDSEIWQRERGGEFDQPIRPESLLHQAPEFIWPGFMLPDSLPLLGNHYGDWLCVRFGSDGQTTEVVHWYHGGGDWIPWGRNLAEAVAFDCMRNRIPGRQQYYANIAAEFDQQFGAGSIPCWAREHLPAEVGDFLVDPNETGERIEGFTDTMLQHDVAATAVRCESILNALDTPLREHLSPSKAHELGVSWEPEAVRWLFDNDLIPRAMLDRISHLLNRDSSELLGQDWDTALAHAKAITEERSDLGWAHEIVGWSLERSHNFSEAVEHYRQALRCSSFADQSVRFRTHWFPEAEGKFAVGRLQHLISNPHQLLSDPYLQIFLESKSQSTRNRVTLYWTRVAEEAVAEKRWNDAYDAYFRAGWDLGCDDLNTYRDLLQRLANAARESEQHARALIAETHLACLNARVL